MLETRDCLLVSVEFPKDQPTVIPRRAGLRINSESPVIARNGFIRAPEVIQCIRFAKPQFKVTCIDFDAALETVQFILVSSQLTVSPALPLPSFSQPIGVGTTDKLFQCMFKTCNGLGK